MNKNDYRSAFAKLAPSEAWKKETLEKMRALEAAGAQAPRAKKAVSLSARLRRAALPVAAVLVLAFVPLTTLRGCGSSGGAAAPARLEEQQSVADAIVGTDGAPQFAPKEELAGDTAQPEETADAPAAGTKGDYGRTAPRFSFSNEDSGDVMGVGANANPTRDLPAQALPAALPVYRALTDPAAQNDVLAQTASRLGQALAVQNGAADTETTGGIRLSLEPYTVLAQGLGERLAGAPSAEMALQACAGGGAAALLPSEALIPAQSGAYGDGSAYLYYEADGPDDSLETRLYRYEFRRVALYVNGDGVLDAVRFTPSLEEIGVYGLYTLDEARRTLLDGGAWLSGVHTPGGYDAGAVNILHWELTYRADSRSGVVLPVYRFLFDTGDGTETEEACVPALPPEYFEDA